MSTAVRGVDCVLCQAVCGSVEELKVHVCSDHLRWLPYECRLCAGGDVRLPTHHSVTLHYAQYHDGDEPQIEHHGNASKQRLLNETVRTSLENTTVTTSTSQSKELTAILPPRQLAAVSLSSATALQPDRANNDVSNWNQAENTVDVELFNEEEHNSSSSTSSVKAPTPVQQIKTEETITIVDEEPATVEHAIISKRVSKKKTNQCAKRGRKRTRSKTNQATGPVDKPSAKAKRNETGNENSNVGSKQIFDWLINNCTSNSNMAFEPAMQTLHPMEEVRERKAASETVSDGEEDPESKHEEEASAGEEDEITGFMSLATMRNFQDKFMRKNPSAVDGTLPMGEYPVLRNSFITFNSQKRAYVAPEILNEAGKKALVQYATLLAQGGRMVAYRTGGPDKSKFKKKQKAASNLSDDEDEEGGMMWVSAECAATTGAIRSFVATLTTFYRKYAGTKCEHIAVPNSLSAPIHRQCPLRVVMSQPHPYKDFYVYALQHLKHLYDQLGEEEKLLALLQSASELRANQQKRERRNQKNCVDINLNAAQKLTLEQHIEDYFKQ